MKNPPHKRLEAAADAIYRHIATMGWCHQLE
jgi:hypothetical protein